ncbi:MAG: hypothetical protein N4A50_00875 [Vallitalea sp.]|jgi:hypothetical protein|nr:hypothetical protein [Vallitalea sp.]
MNNKRKIIYTLLITIVLILFLVYLSNKDYINHFNRFKHNAKISGQNILFSDLVSLENSNTPLNKEEKIKLEKLREIDIQNYTRNNVYKISSGFHYNDVYLYVHDLIYFDELNELNIGISILNLKKLNPHKIHFDIQLNNKQSHLRTIYRSNYDKKLFFERCTFHNISFDKKSSLKMIVKIDNKEATFHIYPKKH